MNKVTIILGLLFVMTGYQNCGSPTAFNKAGGPTLDLAKLSSGGHNGDTGGGHGNGGDDDDDVDRDDDPGVDSDIGYCALRKSDLEHDNRLGGDDHFFQEKRYVGYRTVKQCEWDQPGIHPQDPRCQTQNLIGPFLAPTFGIPTTVTKGVCMSRLACRGLVQDFLKEQGGELLGDPRPVQAVPLNRKYTRFHKADYCTMGASIYVPPTMENSEVEQAIKELKAYQATH